MRIYMDTSALAKLIVAENESLSLLRCEQAEVGGGLEATVRSGCVAGRGERVGPAQRSSSVCRLGGQLYHRAVTLAAIWLAIFNAASAGSALHVLMSIMTLFL